MVSLDINGILKSLKLVRYCILILTPVNKSYFNRLIIYSMDFDLADRLFKRVCKFPNCLVLPLKKK